MGSGLGAAQGAFPTISTTLCCIFKWDTEKSSYYHLQRIARTSRCVCYVPYMQPWFVLFFFSPPFLCSWQFIGFSSPSQGWAIIKPHQAWRGNHSWAFFSHGVFSQWQARWLCSLWVRLSPVPPRDTCARIETGGDGGESLTRQARSSVTVTKQCNTQARRYQRAPRWEIYLRTVTFSAEQRRTGTHRWLILSRRRPAHHSPVTGTCYTHSLLSHSSGQSWRDQRTMQPGSGLSMRSRQWFMLQLIISCFSPFGVFT